MAANAAPANCTLRLREGIPKHIGFSGAEFGPAQRRKYDSRSLHFYPIALLPITGGTAESEFYCRTIPSEVCAERASAWDW